MRTIHNLVWPVGLLLAVPVLMASDPAPPNPPVATDRPDPDAKASPHQVRSARSKATAWLLDHQNDDGGWSSGAHGTNGLTAPSDVATTAYVVRALRREAGTSAQYSNAIRRGVEHVVRAVEQAPPGPRLNTPENTQIQYKLGPLVDTHLAALVLGEVSGTLDPALNARVKQALELAVDKVEQAQNGDGSFESSGWAPVLSTSIAAQSLNQAADLGLDVDEDVLEKSDRYQAALAKPEGGAFDASSGAGVELYAVAGGLSTNAQIAARSAAPAPAKVEAKRVERAAKQRLADNAQQLVIGYGSIGGEEMISYAMISDTLAAEGGKAWTDWEARVGGFLVQVQNGDGSWVGHHCITSQAFTTAGGLMTLTAGEAATRDRSEGA